MLTLTDFFYSVTEPTVALIF